MFPKVLINRLLTVALIYCFTGSLFASEPVKLYEFQASMKNLYQVSCNTAGEQGWTVSKNSCNFYSAAVALPTTDETANNKVIIKTQLINSGNLESRDFAWLFYYVNDKVVRSVTVRGDVVTQDGLVLTDTLVVPAKGNVRMRISFVCDGADEIWRLPNKGITISVEGTPSQIIEIFEPETEHTILVRSENNSTNVTWTEDDLNKTGYYLVERSIDGNKYVFAGYVNSGTIKNDKITYSFTDYTTLEGPVWYRVVVFSENGQKLNALGPATITEE